MGYRISGLTVAAKVNWSDISVRPLETTQVTTAQSISGKLITAQADVDIISAEATGTITLSSVTPMAHAPPPLT